MTTHAPATGGVSTGTAAAAEFRRFMRRWPSGVVVITSGSADEPSGCTVNAFLSVSLSPPLLLVSLAEGSGTLAAIAGRGAFGVNILTWRQRGLAARFAAPAADRFAGLARRVELGVPLLRDAAAVAVCGLDRMVPAADHVLVLGAVRWCELGDASEPVVFFEREYHALPLP
ncbi:MAG TPA: flavin reductase family protein [Actinocrinis sp.]|uniref:flavin reductase family protein n=1 Tax=Actinocrinis sp. TaxID=1920516 RepID=UPI002DDD556B|nr:flavin reductase family protein [Actinocrinis sp.]HEV3174088.1 flavin reductase family protein [Actinocrinis sp.]